LELVPLIVKMAAFYRLMRAAKKMRHVHLTMSSLFGAVIVLTFVVVIFLTVWSIFDPPRIEAEYQVTGEKNDSNEVVVARYYYCISESLAWSYAAVGWHLVLLLTATVQAVQTRLIRKQINESQTLAIMIYSHFVFVILRLIALLLVGTVQVTDLMLVTSLIFSLDAIATINIYFVPKFLAKKPDREKSEIFVESSTVKHLQMLAAIATHEHRLSTKDLDCGSRSSSKRLRDTDNALSLIADPQLKKEVRNLGNLTVSQQSHHTAAADGNESINSMPSPMVDVSEETPPLNAWCRSCAEPYCCPKCGDSFHHLLQKSQETDSDEARTSDSTR
jgi:hypothetical protein